MLIFISTLTLIFKISQIRHRLLSIALLKRGTLHHLTMFFGFLQVIDLKHFLHESELVLLLLID